MAKENINYLVKVNEFEFEFSSEQIEAVDLIKKSPSAFNLLLHHRSVNVKLLESDSTAKTQTIEVEGEIFHIEIKEELDQMLEKMGFGLAANKHIKNIKAPMPGLVLQIVVKAGQEVVEGDKILILEAMKMENSIMIPTAAKIKQIMVKEGQAVEKGQVLVELE